MSYEFWFESEDGMVTALIPAVSRAAAVKRLKELYPDDIGADGFFTDEEGNERAIPW